MEANETEKKGVFNLIKSFAIKKIRTKYIQQIYYRNK